MKPLILALLALLPPLLPLRAAPQSTAAAAARGPPPSPLPLPLPSPSPSPPLPSPPPSGQPVECIFLDYDRNPNLTSYEFQLQPHRGMIWEFEKAAAAIEALMRQITLESRRAQNDAFLGRRRWPTVPANFTFVEGSRWDTVLREHAFAVSSRRGEPLHPQRFPPSTPKHPFPWKRLAYLRLRRYIITLPPGAPGAPPPGTADLAFKMKKVEAKLGPRQGLRFADGVRAKLEQDIHCDHQRTSVSPLFVPVPGDLNVSRVGDVKTWFPGLSEIARVDEGEQLPFCHAVWRRKAVWAVVYRGLMGELSLMAKYNTTLGDAVAGRRAKNGEVSLRVRREVASIAREGETEEERLKALHEAMDALAMATQRFRDEGWDGKTPAMKGAVRGIGDGEGGGEEEDGGEEDNDDEDVVCERGGGNEEEVLV